MSIRLMSKVWESDLPKMEKYILLAYADFASDDGGGIYPSIEYMAWKTGYEGRTIQSATKSMIDTGILLHLGYSGIGTGKGTNLYQIDISKLPSRPSYKPASKRGEILSPLFKRGEIDDKRGEAHGGESISINHKNIHELSGASASTPVSKSPNGRGIEEKKPKAKGSPRDERLDHPALKSYRRLTHLNIPISWRDQVIQAVTHGTLELQKWDKHIKEWVGRGYNPANVEGMLDAFVKGGLKPQAARPQESSKDTDIPILKDGKLHYKDGTVKTI